MDLLRKLDTANWINLNTVESHENIFAQPMCQECLKITYNQQIVYHVMHFLNTYKLTILQTVTYPSDIYLPKGINHFFLQETDAPKDKIVAWT